MARLNRDDIDKFHEYGLYAPARTISLDAPTNEETGEELGVNYAMAQQVIKNLRILDHVSAEPITLLINTGGGDVYQGMAIFDAIRACRSRVIGVVTGEACSMGSVILQACDERKALPFATVMYHAGSFDGAPGAPFREGFVAVAYEAAFCDRIDRVMWERARIKRPKLTYEQFKTLSDRGLYLSAEQARDEWNFLDAIEVPPEQESK